MTHDSARGTEDLGGEVDSELALDDTGVAVGSGHSAVLLALRRREKVWKALRKSNTE
jgi:hypothetical protein